MIYDSIISIDLVNRKAANLMNGNQQLDANTQSAIENYKVLISDQIKTELHERETRCYCKDSSFSFSLLLLFIIISLKLGFQIRDVSWSNLRLLYRYYLYCASFISGSRHAQKRLHNSNNSAFSESNLKIIILL